MTRSDGQYHVWARRDDWTKAKKDSLAKRLRRPSREEQQSVSPITREEGTEEERAKFRVEEYRRSIREGQLPKFEKKGKEFIRNYSQPDELFVELIKDQDGKFSVFSFMVEAGIDVANLACTFEPAADCKTLGDLVEHLRANQRLAYKLTRGRKTDSCRDSDLRITLTEAQYQRLVDFYK